MVDLKSSLTKVNDNLTVYRYDNGYMVEVGGQDSNEDWVTRKIICNSIDDVLTLVTEYSKMPVT